MFNVGSLDDAAAVAQPKFRQFRGNSRQLYLNNNQPTFEFRSNNLLVRVIGTVKMYSLFIMDHDPTSHGGHH